MQGDLSVLFGIIFVIVWWIVFFTCQLRKKYGRSKTVDAEVVNKQAVEVISKYSGTGKVKCYYVTFRFNGKRKSFEVSEFSYKGYQSGEQGTLEFKGSRLVDFS